MGLKRKIAVIGLAMLALLVISQTAAAAPGGSFDPLWIGLDQVWTSGPGGYFDPLSYPGGYFDPL
jgi:hypothetical protein